MNARRSCLRVLGALALIAGVLGLGSASLAAANGKAAAITVHAFWCDKTGDELFPACHRWDYNAIDNAEFRVAGATRFTLNGYVTWKPGAGEHTIQGANMINSRGATVVCTNQVTTMILHAGAAPDDRVTLTTTAGQETICDWYYGVER